SKVIRRTSKRLVCRRTDQVRSHQPHPSAAVSGDSLTKLGCERLGFKGVKLFKIFIKAEVSFTKLKKPTTSPSNPESVNKENALVLHASVEKSLEVNTSKKKVTDDEPRVKKLYFLLPTPSLVLSLKPLNLILLEPIQKPNVTTMTIDQFTEHLTKITASIFSPTPPKELTPPGDPTPPKNESKGKGIATEEPLKRLADIKGEKEKFEKSLKKILNPAKVRAPAQKMVEYEAKRKKMFDEYNHKINHRADQLPITKISYKVNSSKEATMRITIDIKGSRGRVFKEPESGIFFYNGNFDLVFQREEEFCLATTAQLIRLHSAIQRGTPEAEEMFKKRDMTIEARNDVNQARKIVQDNLDGLD
ncbi:hypothetical protein Tco_0899330, partial [Tanacetum coccineum]